VREEVREEKKKKKGKESQTGKEGKKEKRASWAGGEERKTVREDGDGRFSRFGTGDWQAMGSSSWKQFNNRQIEEE
jgi:hypothetical protein